MDISGFGSFNYSQTVGSSGSSAPRGAAPRVQENDTTTLPDNGRRGGPLASAVLQALQQFGVRLEAPANSGAAGQLQSSPAPTRGGISVASTSATASVTSGVSSSQSSAPLSNTQELTSSRDPGQALGAFLHALYGALRSEAQNSSTNGSGSGSGQSASQSNVNAPGAASAAGRLHGLGGVGNDLQQLIFQVSAVRSGNGVSSSVSNSVSNSVSSVAGSSAGRSAGGNAGSSTGSAIGVVANASPLSTSSNGSTLSVNGGLAGETSSVSSSVVQTRLGTTSPNPGIQPSAQASPTESAAAGTGEAVSKTNDSAQARVRHADSGSIDTSALSQLQQSFDNLLAANGVAAGSVSLSSFLQTLQNDYQPGNAVRTGAILNAIA